MAGEQTMKYIFDTKQTAMKMVELDALCKMCSTQAQQNSTSEWSQTLKWRQIEVI